MGPVSLIGDVDLENLANIVGMEVPKRVVLLDNTDIYEVFLGKIIHIDLAAYEDEAVASSKIVVPSRNLGVRPTWATLSSSRPDLTPR